MPKRPPAYCRYRGNYARVRIEGQWIHLGPYGSEESKAKYRRLIAQWAHEQSVEKTATQHAGALDVQNVSEAIFTQCTFSGNDAGSG